MHRFAAAILLWTGTSYAQPASPSSEVVLLEKVIADELAQTRTPGAAMVVVKDGAVVYARGFGRASSEGSAPVTCLGGSSSSSPASRTRTPWSSSSLRRSA